TRASSSRSSGDSTKPLRAPIARWGWSRCEGPSLLDPPRLARFRRGRSGPPFSGGDRLLQIGHVPVQVRELTEPLAPLHLLGRERELHALAPHAFVVALPRASAFCGPTPVHLRVPLHDLVVRDPVDLLLDRELVLRLPCLHDSTGGGFALELRDEELPFSATGLERRDHLGAVEHNVA